MKQFTVNPYGQYAFMLVPNGSVYDVVKDPTVGGDKRPLFSLVTANPNEAFHVGQIVDMTGTGNTFVFEDLRMDKGTDRDYNDVIFQVRNAYGVTEQMDDWIAPGKDWRTSNLGKALIEYTKPYITPIANLIPPPIPSDPSVLEPPTPVLPGDPGDSVFPPAPTPPPGDSSPVQPGVPIVPEVPTLPTDPTNPLPPEPLFDTIDIPESSHILLPIPADYNFPIVNQPLIGIIDTGFAANNPDIDYSRITSGRDWVANDDNSLMQLGEGNEHGTHILGIIGATRNNGIGIEGINDQAPLWVGRAIGSGQWAESLVEYVDHFRQSGQPNGVVNLSLDLTQINPDGSVTTRYELTPAERAAIEYARQSGVLLVVAAGNDGGVMSALGQASQEFDNIITVGAAERVNEEIALAKAMDRSDFSSYGYGLDIVAPGGTAANPELSTVGDDLGTMAGTSVATAKVTGAVSQVWAANPDLSYRQVIEILKSTATDLDEPGWNSETGVGLLNLAAAVALALATKPQEDEEIPASYIPPNWSGEGVAVPSKRAAFTAVS
ncbi:MAG: S8 family serine peptidase [Cyanobacteria bacterium]|nr:S8 family serine peptidase [Cyanobacteriota bacterium]MDW8202144.1 S8 family serine peptidase [Cyanobacteriota bacterium SKYGB_h_bin112]